MDVYWSSGVQKSLFESKWYVMSWVLSKKSNQDTFTIHHLSCPRVAWWEQGICHFYRPQRSCEGYVFTPVCQSFCSQGGLPQCMLGCYPPEAGTPWEQTPPAEPPGCRHPPWEQAPPPGSRPLLQTATAADGTYPTGMHSCIVYILVKSQIEDFWKDLLINIICHAQSDTDIKLTWQKKANRTWVTVM